MLDINNDYKVEESSLSRGLALKSHVIFHVVYFFNTNEDVTNSNYCESLEVYQESVYDGSFFQ